MKQYTSINHRSRGRLGADGAVFSYQFLDVPVPPLPAGAIEVNVSMWPAYLIGLVSGLLLILLLQPFVKESML